MKIVLDTTAICQDFQFRSPHTRLLLDSLTLIPASLHIPAVVVDEACNRIREDLEEYRIRAVSLQKDLARTLAPAESGGVIDPQRIAPESEAAALRKRLEGVVAGSGGILPYPNVAHDVAVRRALDRKRPFKRDGAGYRDYLIWESVRRLMILGNERVVFVTANTSDFAEGGSGGTLCLHADLTADLLNPHQLTLFRTVRELNESLVVPRLAMFASVNAALTDAEAAAILPSGWLHDNFLGLLREAEIGYVVTGFPASVGRVYPTHVVEYKRVAPADIRVTPSSEVLLRLEVEADVAFTVDIDWDDFVDHLAVREYFGPAEEPFSWCSADPIEHISAAVDIILSPEDKTVASAEVVSASGAYGTVDL